MLNPKRHAEAVRKLIDGEVRVYELMRNHTTFRIGGPADIFASPDSIEDVRRLIEYAKVNEIQYHVIGNGSNLLVADNGVKGIVIKIGKRMSKVELDGDIVKAQSGMLLPKLSKMAAQHGLSGLEFGIGIPGTLGGAIVMNAGSGDQNISQVLMSARVMDTQGNITQIEEEDMDFGHRDSRLRSSGEILLEAQLRLQRGKPKLIRARMRQLIDKRKRTMPLDYPNAGSVFKNPEGDYAGRLIEQAGCKGMRKGDAQVSELHANWILNLGRASSEDVVFLMGEVQENVRLQFGVTLKPEVIVLA